MKVNYQDIGLRIKFLYEILATTFSKTQEKLVPNTASMGIRLIEEDIINIFPYPNTTTFKNLKENKFLTINFVDNVYLYALASLKDFDSNKHLEEFSLNYYDFYRFTDKITLPYLKQAWATLFCKVIDETQFTKNDDLGSVIISEFKLEVISFKKYRESFNLYNRAENLALETIILATRLKLAEQKGEKTLYLEYKSKIEYNIEQIKRFGKNLNALKVVDRVQRFIHR